MWEAESKFFVLFVNFEISVKLSGRSGRDRGCGGLSGGCWVMPRHLSDEERLSAEPKSQLELLFRVACDFPLGLPALELIDKAVELDSRSRASLFARDTTLKQKVISLKRTLFEQRVGRRNGAGTEYQPGRNVLRVTCRAAAFSYASARVFPDVCLACDPQLSQNLFLARMQALRKTQWRLDPTPRHFDAARPADLLSWMADVRPVQVSGHAGLLDGEQAVRSVVAEGFGIFAARNLPAGYPLGIYCGIVRYSHEYEAKRQASASRCEYGVDITTFLKLDPTNASGQPVVFVSEGCCNLLPLVNEDPANGRAVNVAMVWDTQPDNVQFVTTRAVRAGEEILTHYGVAYDRSHYAPSASTSASAESVTSGRKRSRSRARAGADVMAEASSHDVAAATENAAGNAAAAAALLGDPRGAELPPPGIPLSLPLLEELEPLEVDRLIATELRRDPLFFDPGEMLIDVPLGSTLVQPMAELVAL